MEGFDPAEIDAIEARLEAAAAQEDIQTIATITAQVCQTLIGLADAVKALGEAVWPATEAITDVARRVSDLDRLGRLQWHSLAIDRGDYELHLEGGEPPFLVTEFGRTPASPEELRRLGIQVEETT